jgi:predicted component of type VI protein secretion system
MHARKRQQWEASLKNILIAGDFGSAARRGPVAVDIDNFDDVMARMATRLELPVAGENVALEFASLDDFHPDALYRRLPSLKKIHDTLLKSGATDADTFTRLVGGAQAPAPQRAAPQTFVQGLIHDAVAPHVVPAAPAYQALYREAADAAVAEHMRLLLHEPRFQALEALWRGVHRLLTGIEADDVKVHVLDVTRAELAAAMADGPWSLIVADYSFGAGDVDLLSQLGASAARLGAPLVADANAELLDDASWPALRKHEVALWIGLAAPRVLMRLPYGKAADPVESLAFEEGRSYLWGSAALACALLIARDELELDDLPAHVYEEDGEKKLQPCAETLLSDRAAQALLEAGPMPFLGSRNRNAVRLMRLQSIATPAQALRGR